MLAFVCLFALLPIVAVVTSGGRQRRMFGFALIVASSALPWLIPSRWPLLRAVGALAVIAGVMRTWELLITRNEWPTMRRVLHVILVVGAPRMEFVAREFQWRRLARIALFGPVAALALAGVLRAPHARGLVANALRSGGGLVFCYAVTEVAYAGMSFLHRAFGLRTPELHRDPVLSRTVQEFWGARWNTTVNAWLREHCFRPLARRGHALAGVTVSFAVSAVIHLYFAWPAAGFGPALVMAGYFLVQGVLVLIELRAGASRWPRFVQHAWFVAAMVVSSPLFVEPMMRVIGVPT